MRVKGIGYSDQKIENIVETSGIEGLVQLKEVDVEAVTTSLDDLGLSLPTTGGSSSSTITKPRALSKDSNTSTASTNTSDGGEGVLKRSDKKAGARSSYGGSISVAGQRGAPLIGVDAEHSSAHTLYEELAYYNIEKQIRQKAISNLVRSFSSLPLEQPTIDRIKEIAEQAIELVPKDERKKVTRNLRGVEYLIESKAFLTRQLNNLEMYASHQADEDIQKQVSNLQNALLRMESIADIGAIKEAIKQGNRAYLSSSVTKIIDHCVFGSNRMLYVNFPTEGVPPNPNTGKERGAKDSMRLLSDLIEEIKEIHILKNSAKGEDQSEALNRFQDIGFKEIFEKWGISENRIGAVLESKSEDDLQDGFDEMLEVRVGKVPGLDSFVKDMLIIFTQKSETGTKKVEAKKRINALLEKEDLIAEFETKWGISKSDISLVLDGSYSKEITSQISRDIALRDEVEVGGGVDAIVHKILRSQYEHKPETVQNKMVRHMGELFYYPHLQQTYRYEIDGVEADWSVRQEEWDKVMDVNEEGESGPKRKYSLGTKPRNNDPEIMYELTGRHLVLVFNCFMGVAEFSERKQERIVNSFISDSMLQDQGWKDHAEGIDLDIITSELEKSVLLDHSNMTFVVAESLRYQELGQGNSNAKDISTIVKR